MKIQRQLTTLIVRYYPPTSKKKNNDVCKRNKKCQKHFNYTFVIFYIIAKAQPQAIPIQQCIFGQGLIRGLAMNKTRKLEMKELMRCLRASANS